MILEQQISILEWFLKDHVTLKTGVIAAENVALITGINYIFKYIQVILNSKIFHNITAFAVFASNKCRFGEQKIILWKNI